MQRIIAHVFTALILVGSIITLKGIFSPVNGRKGMKERSKERKVELLLAELLERLSERENVRRMLDDLSVLPLEEIAANLANDFELAIARRQVETLRTMVARSKLPPTPEETAHHRKSESTTKGPVVQRTPKQTEGASTTKGGEKQPPASPAKEHVPATPAKPPGEDLRTAPPIKAAKESPTADEKTHRSEKSTAFWDKLEQEIRDGILSSRSTEPSRQHDEDGGEYPREEQDDAEGLEETTDGSEPEYVADASEQIKSPCSFSDDDLVYVHGVMAIPEHEVAADTPFMLEEKGIDPKQFAFAFDYEGLRFYLSKAPPTLNVSKAGVLLLGKQESLDLRGVHESTLNDLRLHGTFLPFEFGTLARGKDALLGKIDKHLEKLREQLDLVAATKWWLVSLFVLDTKIAQLVTRDDSPAHRPRTVERTSYSKTPTTRKYDIKLLERILIKEKKLAESVHEELKKTASRSDIDMIVSLGSGSSEEWKPVLKASYEATGSTAAKLFRAVTDLQYRHIMFDLMFSVSSDAEPFAFFIR